MNTNVKHKQSRCECGQPATHKRSGSEICDRCYKLEIAMYGGRAQGKFAGFDFATQTWNGWKGSKYIQLHKFWPPAHWVRDYADI